MTPIATSSPPTGKLSNRRSTLMMLFAILVTAVLGMVANKQYAQYTLDFASNTSTAIDLRFALREGKISTEAALKGFEAVYATPGGGMAAALALIELNQAQDYDARSRLFLRLLSTVPKSGGKYLTTVYSELNAEYPIEKSLSPDDKAYADKCLSGLMPQWIYSISEGLFGSRQPICAPRVESAAAD